LIALISMFFLWGASGVGASLLSTLLLTGVILLGVGMTFLASRLLSATLLRGMPSGFALELPPYRRPQLGRVIVRSVLDRTVFVLGRAMAVAAPAGLVIWLLANITVGEVSLLHHAAAFLDPLGQLLGMDGAILLAFVLGWPANEIVIPILLMIYLSTGTLTEPVSTGMLQALLVHNGWTWVTGACTLLFSLMHWPCSTTCLTVYKETHSLGWTAAAIALPTAFGSACCLLLATAARIFGWG